MFKVALCVALFSLALACTDEEADSETTRLERFPIGAQCMYTVNETTLACRTGPGDKGIKCSAILETDALGALSFKFYGISQMETVEPNAALRKYYLYPSESKGSDLLDRIVEVDGNKVELFLYASDKFVNSGVRVNDSSCYESLISGVFDRVVNTLEYAIGNPPVNVTILGEIVKFNTNPHFGKPHLNKPHLNRPHLNKPHKPNKPKVNTE